MARRLLDSNELIPFFRKKRRDASSASREEASAWAHELSGLHGGAAIASPVYLEFLCGVKDQDEMELAIAFLEGFENIDRGNVSREDWHTAYERARRITSRRRTRQTTDCLLYAIAKRLNCDLITDDFDLRHHSPPRRKPRK